MDAWHGCSTQTALRMQYKADELARTLHKKQTPCALCARADACKLPPSFRACDKATPARCWFACVPARAQGIFPTLSLFNNLMDWYAGELRLGDVARLLTDMTQRARLQVGRLRRGDTAAHCRHCYCLWCCNGPQRLSCLRRNCMVPANYLTFMACWMGDWIRMCAQLRGGVFAITHEQWVWTIQALMHESLWVHELVKTKVTRQQWAFAGLGYTAQAVDHVDLGLRNANSLLPRTCARAQPNMNTFRILLNACQRTDQGALAFEVYEIMKARRLPILQEVRGPACCRPPLRIPPRGLPL